MFFKVDDHLWNEVNYIKDGERFRYAFKNRSNELNETMKTLFSNSENNYYDLEEYISSSYAEIPMGFLMEAPDGFLW